MQMSQNNPYSTFPSSQNDNFKNKFKATLRNFEQYISKAKNQVTNTKRETNSNKYSNFTIWLDSFENFLLELGRQIANLSEIINFHYTDDYNKLSGWINDFVTILEKGIPQNITNKLENNFQQNEINDLNQSILIANKAMNDLKKTIENNNIESYISQSLDEILKNLENSLSNAENGTNCYINKNLEEINLPDIINELDKLSTDFDQQFSNLKIVKHIQSDGLSTDIEEIYSKTIQQINKLQNDLKNLVNNLNCESNESQNNDDVKNVAYNSYIKYMKRFKEQISTAKQDLLGLVNVPANENLGTDNNYQNENNCMNTSGKSMSDVPTRQNTYPFVQENHGQPTLNQQIEELQNANKTLKEEITSLRAETVKYQSALGNATNFRISDNDPNNVSQLAKDIEELKHLLENFCSFKKSDINYTDFEELLSKYGCSSVGKNLNKNKTLVKGILQRHVIELVIENTNKYLQIEGETEQFLETNQGEKGLSLEIILASVTTKLLNYIESFSIHRIGTDEVTKSAPVKLRQLVYAVLRNRGFSKTLNEGEHPFIIKLRNLIVENLNKYRTIKNPLKIDEITELIHHIISIFCFRRKIQEPIVEYKWFENATKVELEFMECPVDEDERDKIMVDICYFPLIGTNLEHDEKYQVITKASIVQTYVNSNN
ncbi:41348_t:CDS:2 [Gigaspora margarita]|uniref:41348_t:CDS:1 n=1 Tax=Gigaspora margarita TaxID=4874 RepID=A0ABN7VIF2_GIGMA|nr:41348_t:CDS:2 [Gigaspora margarita]